MTRQAGIIGYPLGHSLSPAFQQAAFDAVGLDARYERWETPAGDLAERVASLRAPGMLGANVTIPYKEAVLPLLDALSPQAKAIGAVNTIVHEAGRLTGHNTDGPGFVDALRHDAGFEPADRSVLVLGAGGAARGIVFALADAGARSLMITNRTVARAERLAADLSGRTGFEASAGETPAAPGGFECIINTTSLGMAGPDVAALPCRLEGAKPGTLIVDIVYRPEQTAWLADAAARGLPTLGGLPMLIEQGVRAFELWTGVAAPRAVMIDATRRALEGQG